MQILARAYEFVPETKDMADGVDEFRNDSLEKLQPADTFILPNSDITIDGQTGVSPHRLFSK